MRITTFFVFLVLIVTFLHSCKKENEMIQQNQVFTNGAFINRQFIDGKYTFERTPALIEDAYGIQFKTNDELIERKNIGWCGTPPITYGDFSGNWSGNDSIIDLTTKYWGGTHILKWKIVSINDQSLVVEELDSKYIED